VIRNWKRFAEAGAATAVQLPWSCDPAPAQVTTPAYSPESNGLAEALIGTFKRDYVDGADRRDAETVLAQLGGWFDDYNTQAPHSALGMRSPADYRAEQLTLSSSR
jgi:transposase InsO family protein